MCEVVGSIGGTPTCTSNTAHATGILNGLLAVCHSSKAEICQQLAQGAKHFKPAIKAAASGSSVVIEEQATFVSQLDACMSGEPMLANTIPAGLEPGQSFEVDFNGHTVQCEVPPRLLWRQHHFRSAATH